MDPGPPPYSKTLVSLFLGSCLSYQIFDNLFSNFPFTAGIKVSMNSWNGLGCSLPNIRGKLLNKSKSRFLSLNVLASVWNTLLSAKLAFLAACSYLTKPALAIWESKLSLFRPGEKGFNPNKFKCVPVNPTPACANVEVGKYTPWLTVPPAVPGPTEASVFTEVLDNTFCFAVNNKPLGDFKSKNICANRLTSSIDLIGAINPPRKIESGPPVLNILEPSSS